MSDALPDLYFRRRENGATVFRVRAEGAGGALELLPLASVAMRSGEVRALGGAEIARDEAAQIARWLEARRAEIDREDAARLPALIDHVNRTAHWVQSRATDEHLEAGTEPLLLALHDLRSALVRAKGARRGRAEDDG
ncbi:hypothetical protein [Poseidonocella sedimentorum]|uniref:Uncharacterized protein n=1 Tax=Poseidonocella sedimentorum TaxID=871652 RepID=A0A1I6EMR2_9RHOB|nr:hypothetical protein [Poseidonocella sedimentorum]SFR19044.1 hypothetical protein SAMN04515673_11545 [Poseidonocella sedimentorum]